MHVPVNTYAFEFSPINSQRVERCRGVEVKSELRLFSYLSSIFLLSKREWGLHLTTSPPKVSSSIQDSKHSF